VSPAAPAARAWLHALLWLWLGAWLGAMGLFGSLTRVVFQVIPQPEAAGHLVARLLGPLLAFGAVSGLGLALLAIALGRGSGAVLLPILLAAVCLVNEFGVARAVEAVRLGEPGLAPGQALRFVWLHRLSVVLFLVTAAGAVVLALVHARADARESRPGASTASRRS
jgi:hypothetical protein